MTRQIADITVAFAGTSTALGGTIGEFEGRVTDRLMILAVDDEPLILVNTVAMLEDMGHEVLEANSGKEALELAQPDQHLDLIITDQSMPDMNGTELIRHISQDHPAVCAILATGYDQIPEGARDGIVLLRKPFTYQDLEQAVKAAVPPVRD